jgi:hypothetical protein
MGSLGVAMLAAACGEGGPESSPRGGAGEGAEAPVGDAGEILVFSNSSPHVTAIDILTEEVARTGDVDGLVTMFLRMTSVGGRLRDSAERAEACKISYACGTQNLGTKR